MLKMTCITERYICPNFFRHNSLLMLKNFHAKHYASIIYIFSEVCLLKQRIHFILNKLKVSDRKIVTLLPVNILFLVFSNINVPFFLRSYPSAKHSLKVFKYNCMISYWVRAYGESCGQQGNYRSDI